MNRIYKLKFDKRRNELVIVSEITAGAGKEKSTGHIADLAALSPFRKLLGTLTPVALLTGLIAGLLPAMVLAADLPTGGQIVGGQGSISTSGNQMTIHQQTQNMATNWHSFDIGKNNTVQFVQPDSSSVALNRVTGASGSQIMGTLKANGQVFILNPNGVLFGKNARVDVGGLVASTKNISTADFMKGQYTLSGEGNPGAQVINQGSLTTAKGGYIVLAGERVSNSGTVTTPGGKTVLAAGKTVTLQLDNGGLTSVSVNGSVVNALVENRGLISATNGQVYLTAKGQDMLLNTVVNNSGTVEAKGLASRGGEIVLSGGDSGVVSQSGHLLADSQTGQGGKITLEGQNIHLAGGSLTSATGKTGGGEVYVGGGWQGKDSRIRNASKVVMDKTSTVDVSATDAGNGGTAVLWSDDYTNFRGTVLAKGGALSGNGGRVETSSHHNLQAYGTVDASSPSGKGGEWLLDPTDVTIVGTGTDSNIDSTTNAGIFTPTGSGAQILNSSIVNQLNAGTNVTVKTSGTDTEGQTGNITVNANIVKTAGADAKLTLLADNNISTANNIAIGATTGKLNLDLLAGNTSNTASVVLGNNISISLNGGDFLAGAANPDSAVSLTYRNNGLIYGGNVTLNVTGGLSGYAYKVQADNDLTINGPVSGNTGWGTPLSFIAGGKLEMNSPTSISLTATDTANGGGTVVISGDKGVSLSAGDGNILLSAASAATNSVNVSSGNGTVSMNAGGNLTLVCATVTSGAAQDITLNAAGKNSARVNITGSTINSNGGNISIDHAAEGQAMTILISGSTLNTSDTNDASHKGNITLSAYNPNVDLTVSSLTSTVRNGSSMIDIGNNSNLTGDNITTVATQDGSNGKGLPLYMHGVTLQADGDISLSGVATGGATPAQLELRGAGNSLTSVNGNISLQTQGGGRIFLNGTSSGKAVLSAENGTINLGGDDGRADVALTNADLSSANMNIAGSTTRGYGDTPSLRGGVTIYGNVSLRVADNGKGVIKGTADISGRHAFTGAIVIGSLWGAATNILFDGEFEISGQHTGTGGSTKNGGIFYNGAANLTFTKDSTLTGIGTNGIAGISGEFSAYNTSSLVNYKLQSGANLTMNAVSDTGSAISAVPVNASNKYSVGYVFSGDGDVILLANSGSSKPTLYVNNLNNSKLNGSFSVHAVNTNGDAIVFQGLNNQNLINANITGISESGTGIRIESNGKSNVSLSGSVIHGVSNTGNGIIISGDNTTITDGTIHGKTVSGNSSGVLLTGGSNYTLDGVSVIGNAADGSGVMVNGSLTVNNGTTAEGNVTGSGNGVTVSGNLTTANGGGIILNGTATSGDGIKVGGDTSLVNATLNGSADSGVGVNIAGNLTTDSVTQVNGLASGGTGVNLGASLTGASVKGSSDTGTGLQLADNAVVTEAVLSGNSASGDGVAVTGNISLDDTTAAALNATSGSGAGLSLEDSANVSIVSITTVTQEKKGPDGNTVTDATGNPVMETITMTTPVTTPVTLTGISQSGSGVATSGNVSISGVVLNGSSTSAGGSGATLGGNLTIADDISGITVNATGNGTGLVMDNVTVNADGYTSTGKNFVINASTSDSSGTAIRTQGNNQLAGVTLNGSADNGGTAVVLGGQVSGASVTGTSDSGTAVRVSDTRLTNTVVTGNATGNGTGVALSGAVSLDKTTAEALNAVSSGGTGLSLEQSANVSVTGLDAVSTAELKGLSQSGSGITTAGNVAIRGIVLNGSASTDSGVGVTLGGNLTIGDDVSRVTAGATGSGTALVIDNATLQANGYAGTNKGPVILADASGAGGTAVKIQGDNQLNDVAIVGSATSDGGTGVLLGGQVTGANILGTAGSGTGVVVTDGTLMDGGTVKGRSHNGTGLAAGGNVTLNHALISGEAQGDGGTGVSLNGSITGGTVNGTSTSGDAVRIKDALFTGTEVNGVAQSGVGVKTQGNVTLKSTELSATSENGEAALEVSGTLNHDQNTVMRADRVVGQDNIHELQPDTPPSPEEGGATGSGGNTTPDTGNSGGVAGSDTGAGETGGTITPPPGGTGGNAGNNGNTGSATGGEGSLPENNVAQRGEAIGPDIRGQMTGQMFVSAFRQQAVNAQVTRMNQAAQDGFHSAATPVVPVTGYQAKPQNVEISLCDGDSCQPESLDAARPAEGVVTSSGK
ncbi:filamentous hemagglutinin N-terminal domain-containing protein [Salmonella enterica]|nr:filamentous hemagglutinin N-terminal domain-containing protein [Salmonella enterica]EBG6424119.1 filamentous hemagglutinin N-terminal domain-containing protein [Salmonella enterica]ECL4766114.1 filamentous hemagglutinin N-terminal domain-containing protein [Salmonella enterica]EEL1942658.1 filamentous hemagglutinin N-terminal domain-containing protein [Salmonella enterica]EIB6304505.1 filamentous hemagglutinin N-terminal domain-containing protein [Salmonella enterica]